MYFEYNNEIKYKWLKYYKKYAHIQMNLNQIKGINLCVIEFNNLLSTLFK